MMWSPRSSGSPAGSPSPSPVSATFTDGRQKNPGRRFAQIIRLKPEHVAEYKACHAKVWPEVLKQIKDCSIREYSIFWDDNTGILFATFKYVGYDYKGDMERMAENIKVREWWRMTDSYQESFVKGAVSSQAGKPSWWKPVEEVFYMA